MDASAEVVNRIVASKIKGCGSQSWAQRSVRPNASAGVYGAGDGNLTQIRSLGRCRSVEVFDSETESNNRVASEQESQACEATDHGGQISDCDWRFLDDTRDAPANRVSAFADKTM